MDVNCKVWGLHIQIDTLFAVGPHQKMKWGVFGMGWCAKSMLINERKVLRQSKTIFSNRRNQFLESQGYTSYWDKILGTEMCIKFESEEISTTGDDCSKSDSKEVRVDEVIDCQLGEAKRRLLSIMPKCFKISFKK